MFVVLGHTDCLPKSYMAYIYSFHMPAFFILSGFLFNQNIGDNLILWVKRRFRRLIVPAWILGALCGIPFLISLFMHHGEMHLDTFLLKLYGTATGYPLHSYTFNCTPLWYLYCLFTTEVIVCLIFSLSRYALLTTYIVGLLGIFVSNYVQIVLPFNPLIAMTGTLYFAIGISIKNNLKKLEYYSLQVVALSVLFFCGGNIFFSPQVNMAANDVGAGWLALVNVVIAISGSITIFCISNMLFRIVLARRALCWIGINTLVIIGFDYYANNLVVQGHRALNIQASFYMNFLIKIILLVTMAWIISRVSLLNQLINGRPAVLK